MKNINKKMISFTCAYLIAPCLLATQLDPANYLIDGEQVGTFIPAFTFTLFVTGAVKFGMDTLNMFKETLKLWR